MITIQDAVLKDLPNEIYKQNSKNYVIIESRTAKKSQKSFLPDFRDTLDNLLVKKLKESNLTVKIEDGLIKVVRQNIEKTFYSLNKKDVYEYSKFFYRQEKPERKTNLLRISFN